MLPDVVDEATLKSNVRREELFYAFFVFGNKFAGGATLGISTAIYTSVHVKGTIIVVRILNGDVLQDSRV